MWDDCSFVADNISIRSLANFSRFFTDNRTGAASAALSADTYRPLTTFSYAVDYLIWGLNTFGYHLTNIAAHSVNSMLVFLLFMLLCDNFFTAFLGSLIFAAHPANTEVVAWISGRSSVLFFLFYISSLIFYIRATSENKREYYILSLFLFVLSLFSKEMAVTLPLILIAYDIYFSAREGLKKRVLRYIPYFLLVILYVSIRVLLIRKIGQFEGWGGPGLVFFAMCGVLVDYMRILIFPIKLCVLAYHIPAIVFIRGPLLMLPAFSLAAILANIPFLFKRYKIISFALVWFFITLLPVLNIIPIKAVEAERFLYLPSLSFCLIVASVVSGIDKRFGRHGIGSARIAIVLAAVLITAYSVRTILRNMDWRSEATISKKTIEANPLSAWAFTALGKNLIQQGRCAEALGPLKSAIEISPDYELAQGSLGTCYVQLGRYAEAIPHLVKAHKAAPDSFVIMNLLGVAYANVNKYDDSERQFKAAIKKDPKYMNAYLNLGRLYETKGDYSSAARQYIMILENTFDPPDTAVAFIRIADVYFKMGSREKARFYYDKAMRIGKDYYPIPGIVEKRLKALVGGAEGGS